MKGNPLLAVWKPREITKEIIHKSIHPLVRTLRTFVITRINTQQQFLRMRHGFPCTKDVIQVLWACILYWGYEIVVYAPFYSYVKPNPKLFTCFIDQSSSLQGWASGLHCLRTLLQSIALNTDPQKSPHTMVWIWYKLCIKPGGGGGKYRICEKYKPIPSYASWHAPNLVANYKFSACQRNIPLMRLSVVYRNGFSGSKIRWCLAWCIQIPFTRTRFILGLWTIRSSSVCRCI